MVNRLNEAGAVLIAKLSLGALALNDIWFAGQTMNPWLIEEGASGSSAGPGAATAAALVGFSIGSETGGSIVGPRCAAASPDCARPGEPVAAVLAYPPRPTRRHFDRPVVRRRDGFPRGHGAGAGIWSSRRAAAGILDSCADPAAVVTL